MPIRSTEPAVRTISSRPDVGVTASVVQRSALVVHTFVSDHPALIYLRRGKKTVTVGDTTVVLRPGDAVAIAAGAVCDVRNDLEHGQFESTWIVCAEGLVAQAAARHPSARPLEAAVRIRTPGTELTRAFERATEAITIPDAVPVSIAAHRVAELLEWLAETGFMFAPEATTDLPRRIRLMVGAAPAQPWVAQQVAHALAMSEASLRRRLAERDTSFNAIVTDVRMTTALNLLQVTDASIGEIAYHVGYASASRFAVRFKKRFGFSPHAVRGTSAPRVSR